MSTPQSTVYICSGVKLDNRYTHTIYWDSLTDQQEYFAGKVVRTFPAYTFLRKKWSIKVGATMEDALDWSYLYFRNGTGKFMYYFINTVEYVNDATVELFLELDVMQTYARDYTMLQAFVERNHVADDTFGFHLVDEGLETGELVTRGTLDVDLSAMCILVQSTVNLNDTNDATYDKQADGGLIGGVYNGCGVYAYHAESAEQITIDIQSMDTLSKTDAVVAMWMYPKRLVKISDTQTMADVGIAAQGRPYVVKGIKSDNLPWEYERPKVIGDFTPNNNKVLCYPYSFLYVTNNAGETAVLPFEFFGDPEFPVFRLTGAISPDGGVRLYPLNYKGEQYAYEHGVNLPGFPSCSWNSDTYKLWLAQNQAQHSLAMASAGAQIVAGVAGAVMTGGIGGVMGAGSVIGGMSTIANILAQKKDMSIQPPQARGNYSTSINMSAGFQTFTIMRKSITVEYARIIDGFFDMYGYKINAVMTPRRKVRKHWTYLKTQNAAISGAINSEDKVHIESILDNGITFWVNGDNIGNYSFAEDNTTI